MIERSLVVEMTANVIIRTAFVFSFFLLFRGHNAPGGGFVAGLVIVACLMIRLVASGHEGIEAALPVSPVVMMGLGLSTGLATGAGGWLWGDAFLEAISLSPEIAVFGELHLSSALLFDIGVFLVVVGVGASLILALSEGDIETKEVP